MHASTKCILTWPPQQKRKVPLLLGEMLEDVGFTAAEQTVHFVVGGIPMLGPFPATGVFPERRRVAALRKCDLFYGDP